jgi:NhaP-type Na+/H+ or K+/H+ antiporter
MHTFNIALLVFGGVTLLLGLTSGVVKNRYSISEPIVAVLAGILVGPQVWGLIDLAPLGDPMFIVEEAARLTLAIALMTVALQLPDQFFSRHWRSLAVLLGAVMPLMWLVSGLLTYGLLDVSLPTALLLGAAITPTDPVLASSIVTGKIATEGLSGKLRHTISAEAGANDALAYPLVMLPMLIGREGWPAAVQTWALETILWQVIGSAAMGAVIGYLAGRLLDRIRKSPVVDLVTLQTVGLSLAVTVTGCVKLIHGEGLLAVFVAGVFMNRVITGEFGREKKEMNENFKRFLDIPVCVLFGTVLPWGAWHDLGLTGLGLAVAVLILRRLPAVLLFRPLLRTVATPAEALFMGWFGPIGIAALYYTHMVVDKGGDAVVWEAGSLIIFVSLIAHGVSATPLTLRMGRMRKKGGAAQGT